MVRCLRDKALYYDIPGNAAQEELCRFQRPLLGHSCYDTLKILPCEPGSAWDMEIMDLHSLASRSGHGRSSADEIIPALTWKPQYDMRTDLQAMCMCPFHRVEVLGTAMSAAYIAESAVACGFKPELHPGIP